MLNVTYDEMSQGAVIIQHSPTLSLYKVLGPYCRQLRKGDVLIEVLNIKTKERLIRLTSDFKYFLRLSTEEAQYEALVLGYSVDTIQRYINPQYSVLLEAS